MTVFGSEQLILASKSPRRRELLDLVGLNFTIVPSGVDETIPAGTAPRDAVTMLSQAKAQAVASRYPAAVVVAADTVVVAYDARQQRERILGQPVSDEEALEMLEFLSGTLHHVYTSFSIHSLARKLAVTRRVESSVKFRQLSAAEIAGYIRSGEGRDKAGAYGAQGLGSIFIEEIRGSFSNIVGLPLAEFITELSSLGLWSPELMGAAKNDSDR